MTTILVVEDDPQVRKFIRLALESKGFSVSETNNGVEALNYCDATLPDLVISDILMPGEGGLKVISTIRKRTDTLPILAISGGGKDGKLNFLATAGSFNNVETLAKPFDKPSLLNSVEKLLNGKK